MSETVYAKIPPQVLFEVPGKRCIYTNHYFRNQFGLDTAKLSEKPFQDWVHPDDWKNLSSLINRNIADANARLKDSAGNWHDFSWKVRRLKGADYLLALKSTGHEQQLIQQSLDDDALQNGLKSTLSNMARIVENKNPGMRCSILLLDENQEYVALGAGPSLPDEYNKMVEGLHIGPTVGSCGTAAFWNIPVAVENIFEDPLWEPLRDAAVVAGVSSCWSHPIVTTSGKVLGAMALYNDEPRRPERHHLDGLEIAARMVGMAVEKSELESQLIQAAKLEALGVLAGGIAHDFNNLLTAILGNAELAIVNLENKEKTRNMLSEVVAASMKAMELCRQMLAYAGQGSFSQDQFDCNKEIVELGDLLKVAISKKAQLNYQLDARRPGVLGDRSQLRQVIMNLITNAAEAMGNQEGEIDIKTDIVNLDESFIKAISPEKKLPVGNYCLIEVSDKGEGMDELTLQRIFDPFFTTKSSGRGLGLAAVQGIVQGHNGAITVESVKGNGTVFMVYLPNQLLEFREEPLLNECVCENQTVILVVDDEKQVRSVFSEILEESGYKVLLASDGEEAVSIFQQERESIDCVLLDFSMPKLDGLEVLQELQKMDGHLPVILTSGFAEKDLGPDLKQAGLAGFIQKPVPMKTLLSRIEGILHSYR